MDVTCLKQYSIYLMHKQRNFLHHSTRKVKFSETGMKAMCEHFFFLCSQLYFSMVILTFAWNCPCVFS